MIVQLDAVELSRQIHRRDLSCREVVAAYLSHIEDVNPRVNALVSLRDGDVLLEEAAAADQLLARGESKGWMHGFPHAVKDLAATRGIPTTQGSPLFRDFVPDVDAVVVERIRRAGAIVIGKSNVPEFGLGSHTYNPVFGPTRNPYALDRNPCGSSSGTGAGISANFAAAGIGTETDGSIVCPSSSNGLAGIKPTVGLVSRAGIIPISHTQDGAGPMCRTLRDAAIVLGGLTGVDPEDSATSPSAGKAQSDYAQYCDPNGLKGARIGVARKYFGFNDAVDALMEQSLDVMKKQGAILVDPADIETLGKFDDSEALLFMYELKADLAAYLGRLGPGAPVKSLKDVIEFNDRNRAKEMPYFGQDLLVKSETKGPLTEKEYLDALAKNHQLARTEGIDATMDKFHLDAIVGPTGGPAWITDLITGDHFSGGSSNAAAVAGYPNINVTAGSVSGLPVGISFFGRAWSEPTLIKLAYSFEQATRARQKPRFLPTIGPA